MELIYYNSYDDYYKDIFGAVSCNKYIRFRIKIYSKSNIQSAFIRLWIDNKEIKEKMTFDKEKEGLKEYIVTVKMPETPCLVWYFFIVNMDNKTYYYGNNDNQFGGRGKVTEYEPKSYQITVYKKNTNISPDWFKEAVMYQIFVERFYNGNEDGSILNPKPQALVHPNWYDSPIYIKDNNGDILRWDFFGGNLLGIRKKLKYLKDLGISVIYLNPIFEAQSNHKYDTGDYKKIDPMFGDEKIFEKLCKEADKLGIKIILDGVFSHTGTDSIYFNKYGNYDEVGAYQSKESKYYSWYDFINYPNEYICWWGIENLPNVIETEDSYMDFIIRDEDSVLKHWMKLGAKGWRLDVVDELPEEFVKLFYKTMKEVDKESILIGEVWEDATKKESYGVLREYFLGEELDSVTNYPLRNILINFFLFGNKNAEYSMHAIMSLIENYPKHNLYSLMNHISNHDLPRILTVIEEFLDTDNNRMKSKVDYDIYKEIVIKVLQQITLFQMTFPGVPCVYYGDEAGLEGGKDPFNRQTYPWDKENHIILNWYKKIIKIRNENDVLKSGEFYPLYCKGDILSFSRVISDNKDAFNNKKQNGKIIIIFNRSLTDKREFELETYKSERYVDLINKDNFKTKENRLNILLEPLESKILLKE